MRRNLQSGSVVGRARWLALGLLLSCGGGKDTGFSVIWEISPPNKPTDCAPSDPIDSVVVRVSQNDGTKEDSKQLMASFGTFFQEPGITNQVMAVAGPNAKSLTLVVDGLKGERGVTQLHDTVNVDGAQQQIKRVQLPVPLPPSNLMCDPLASSGSNMQKCIYTLKTAATPTTPPVYEFRCGAGGTKMRGERCAGDTECGPGTLCGCLGTNAMPPCTCRKFCETGQDVRDCGMANQCDVGLPGTTQFRLCLDACTLFMTTCPDSGDCKVLGGLGKVACVAVGTSPEGQRCTRSSDCARGLACFPPTSSCQQQCDTGHPCATGTCMSGICSGSGGGTGGAGGAGAGGAGGAGGSGVSPIVVSDYGPDVDLFSAEVWPLR